MIIQLLVQWVNKLCNSSPWQAKGSLGWWRWSSTGSPPVGSDLRLWPGCYPCGRTQSPSTPPWPDQFEKTQITSEKVHTLLSISQVTADRKITRNNKKPCLWGESLWLKKINFVAWQQFIFWITQWIFKHLLLSKQLIIPQVKQKHRGWFHRPTWQSSRKHGLFFFKLLRGPNTVNFSLFTTKVFFFFLTFTVVHIHEHNHAARSFVLC